MNARGFIPASRILGLLSVLPIIALLFVAIYLYHSAKGFMGRAVSCQGKVVEMRSTQNSQNGTTTTEYAPVYTFTDSAGVTHRGESDTYSNPPSYSVGDPIALLYDPNNPQDVRINSFWSLWLGTFLSFALTIPFIFTTVLFLFLVPFTIRRVWPESSSTPGVPPALPGNMPSRPSSQR
jgi:hypothetical protein